MSTPTSASGGGPYAHLRAHAAQAKQRTVERLRDAIAAIERRGDPVTTAAIKREGNLDYSAYYRNDEAYALYREHATHFKPALGASRKRRQRTTRSIGEQPASAGARQIRDPLMAYKRPALVAKVRAAQAERDAARAERDEATRQYQNLLREHLQCAQTIFTLQTKLAQFDEHRDYLRRTMQEREHHP